MDSQTRDSNTNTRLNQQYSFNLVEPFNLNITNSNNFLHSVDKNSIESQKKMQGDKNEILMKTLEQSKFLTDYLSQINVADHVASQDEVEIPAFSGQTTLIKREFISWSADFDKLKTKIDNIEHVLRQNIITIKDEMSTIGASLTNEVQNSRGGIYIDIFKEEISKQINNIFPKLIQDINLKHEQTLSTQFEELKRELSIHNRLLEHILENQKIANCQQCLTAPTGNNSNSLSKSYSFVKQEEKEYSIQKLPQGLVKMSEQSSILRQNNTNNTNNTNIAHHSLLNTEQSTQSDSTKNCPPITKLSNTAKIKRKLIIDVDLEQEIKEALSNRSSKQLKR